MPLHEVKSTDDSYVHLLITALIRDNQDAIVSNLDTLLKSILESSRGTPLHFIVLTDHTSSQIVRSKISNIVGKQLFNLFIKNSLRGPYIFPRLKVEFVELKQLTDKYREQIDIMKILFGEGQESDQEASTDPDEEIQDFIFKSTDKYLQDLYYISPLFHTEVNNSLNKIIAIDLDLTFKYVYMTENCIFVNINVLLVLGLMLRSCMTCLTTSKNLRSWVWPTSCILTTSLPLRTTGDTTPAHRSAARAGFRYAHF